MTLILAILLGTFTVYLIEILRHQATLRCLPCRIHINGTRGKSSVTRLIAAGLRGNIYRSADQGKTWLKVSTESQSTICQGIQPNDGRIIPVGLTGVILTSNDDGQSFQVRRQQKDRLSIAAVTSCSVVCSFEMIQRSAKLNSTSSLVRPVS